jgi:hypothetical protein
MAKGAKLPVETIARWPRFVAEAQPVVSGGKLVGQFVHRIRLVADLSPVADLAPPTILGQTHGNLAFANIQTNVNCCIFSTARLLCLRLCPVCRPTLILIARRAIRLLYAEASYIRVWVASPEEDVFRWDVVTHQEF